MPSTGSSASVRAVARGPDNSASSAQWTSSSARAEAGFAYGAATVTTRSALEALRGDRTPRASTIKRAVQRLLDQVLANEAAMLGLVTAGEDTDEIASHMVAVAILSIGLGRYLGLSRDQLYDLGFAALLHNLGMMRMPADLLHKPGKLTPEERFGAPYWVVHRADLQTILLDAARGRPGIRLRSFRA